MTPATSSLGADNQASGDAAGNFVLGFGNQASGVAVGNGVIGAFNQSSGFASGNGVAGVNNQANGFATGNGVLGWNNQASGAFTGNGVAGFNNIATGVGSGNGVTGSDNIAIGTGAGNGVNANDAISIGTGAVAQGNHSTALGAGAVANQDNLMVFGTRQDTYRAPGITSQLSKNRQNGDLEIVTSDAAGNLATDGGDTFKHFEVIDKRLDNRDDKRIDENKSGVALAISIENPDLVANERFGVAMNYGNFEGASALSWSAMGVLGYDVLSRGDRLPSPAASALASRRVLATTSGAAVSARSGPGAGSLLPTS